MNGSDTIAAVSTAPGEGGIGIVRISGDKAAGILGKIFALPAQEKPGGGDFPDRKIRYGHIVDPSSSETVDEVLVMLMKGPRSYTGEDVCEIQCHGGGIPLRRILDIVCGLGALPAQPGEFTKRAFLNGRIDLAQAGAVIDLIRSKTARGYHAAKEQAEGRLSERVAAVREMLLDALAGIAVRIDYPEAFEEDFDNISDIVVRLEAAGEAGEAAAEAGAEGSDIVVMPGEEGKAAAEAEAEGSDIVVMPGEVGKVTKEEEAEGSDIVVKPEAAGEAGEAPGVEGSDIVVKQEAAEKAGEVAGTDGSDIEEVLNKAGGMLAGLLEGAEAGRIVRDGVRVAIIGKPNTGKSSLFNALSREDAAIVTATPGTTRDALEIWLDIHGIPVLLTDTAGIRESAGEIEALGIERAMEQYRKSDAAILVLDGSSPISEEDADAVRRLDPCKPLIVVINKEDLPQAFGMEDAAGFLPFSCGQEKIIQISLIGDGIKKSVGKVEGLLEETMLGGAFAGSSLLVTKARHKAMLETAESEIAEAVDVLKRGEALEFAEVNIRAAWNALGEITGETAADDVIDRVFEEFCVGK